MTQTEAVADKTIEIKLSVSIKQISDLLCCAFEGGSNYWYTIEDKKEPPSFDFRSDPNRIFPHLDYPLNDGGSLLIGSLEKDEIDGKTVWTLDLPAIEKGLKVFAREHARHFADLLEEITDGATGDVFLQCCLFGRVEFC